MSSSSGDQVFHLQLAISKLEEEVKLYRNGTTAESLLELLHEKDRENAQLKAALGETSDKLRRIAKGSTELITKCQELQRERDESLQQLTACQKELSERQTESEAVATRAQELSEAVATRAQELSEALEQRDEDVVKLQARCAALLAEKNEKSKLLEKEKAERSHQFKEFTSQLEKGIKFNTEIKERLRREQTSNIDLTTQLADLTAVAATEKANSQALRLQLKGLQVENDEIAANLRQLKATNATSSEVNEQLKLKLLRADEELQRQDNMLRAKGLKDKLANPPPCYVDGSMKPERHALSNIDNKL